LPYGKETHMELLGVWKLKEMLWVGKGKFRRVSDTEIAAMEPSDENRELRRMLEAEFVLSETALDIFYRPREGEEGLAAEKGWQGKLPWRGEGAQRGVFRIAVAGFRQISAEAVVLGTVSPRPGKM